MNDLDFVLRTVDLLRSEGVRTWVCGSWGEELRGLAPPRAHADLDLLYPARDWGRVDALDLAWGERRPEQRFFTLEETRVELLLVERDAYGWFTQRPEGRHDWADDVFAARGPLPVASAAALHGYRRSYRRAA